MVPAWCGRTSVQDAVSRWIGSSRWTHWCNKGRGVCYPVCGMELTKEPLLLIGKSCPCSGESGFHLLLRVLYHMSDATLGTLPLPGTFPLGQTPPPFPPPPEYSSLVHSPSWKTLQEYPPPPPIKYIN